MKAQLSKDDKINKIVRNVKIPCVGCGDLLKFSIKNKIVVEGEGTIVCNIPGAVCPDCIDSVLEKVADPPGPVCFKNLNPNIAQEFLSNFELMLPQHEAINFFESLFPELN